MSWKIVSTSGQNCSVLVFDNTRTIWLRECQKVVKINITRLFNQIFVVSGVPFVQTLADPENPPVSPQGNRNLYAIISFSKYSQTVFFVGKIWILHYEPKKITYLCCEPTPHFIQLWSLVGVRTNLRTRRLARLSSVVVRLSSETPTEWKFVTHLLTFLLSHS